MVELSSGHESTQEESGTEQRSSSCHNVGIRENMKCESQWRAVFEAQPEGELFLLFPYPRVLPIIGNSVPTLAFLSKSREEELLEDSSQLSLR